MGGQIKFLPFALIATCFFSRMRHFTKQILSSAFAEDWLIFYSVFAPLSRKRTKQNEFIGKHFDPNVLEKSVVAFPKHTVSKYAGSVCALILLCCLSTWQSVAQTCEEDPINCAGMSIEIVPIDNNNPSGAINCPSGGPFCNQQRFQVYLNTSGLTPPCLNYNNFGVLVEIESSSPNNKVWSKINKEDTKDCSHRWTKDELYVTNKNVGVILSGQDRPYFELPSSHIWLFTIVMDAVPGETIHLNVDYAFYTWISAEGLSESCLIEGMPVHFTVPAPATDNNVETAFGDPYLSGFPHYIDVPLNIKSGFSDVVESLEVIFRATPDDKSFAAPAITTSLPGSILEGPFALLDSTTGISSYTYRLTVSNFTLAQGETLLARLRVSAPNMFQKCGKVCVNITGARIKFGNNDCRTPKFSATGGQCAMFNQCLPMCVPDMEVFAEVLDATTRGSNNTCRIAVRMGFNWVGPSPMLLSKARMAFEFQGQGISILNIGSLAVVCDTLNASPFCSGNQCLTFNGNTMTLCFDQSPGTSALELNKALGRDTGDILVTLSVPQGGCLTGVVLTQAEIWQVGAANACVPFVSAINFDMPTCLPYISGNIKTETHQGIRDVSVGATGGNGCSRSTTTTLAGDYSFCTCDTGVYMITPVRDDNPLNGVTTLDLSMISKHILGINLLSSPYKLIAADVNKTGTISTLDIVALRRLILGIDEELSNNTSWRFVPKDFVFPNPQNPFAQVFPENLTINTTNANPYVSGADFVGIKVGDVNNTAWPRTMSTPQALQVLGRTVKTGELFTLPLRFAGNARLTALQTALRFDPSLMEFVSPAAGDVEGISPDCFGLREVQQGIIRLVWLARDPVEAPLQAGQVLCQLTFRAKKTIPASVIPLRLDENNRLKPEGYTLSADAVYPLAMQRDVVEERGAPEASSALVSIECRPNPAKGVATLFIEAERAVEQGRLFILDGFGRRVAYRELYIAEGPSQVSLKEAPAWPAGLYHWVFLSGSERLSEGSFLKAD